MPGIAHLSYSEVMAACLLFLNQLFFEGIQDEDKKWLKDHRRYCISLPYWIHDAVLSSWFDLLGQLLPLNPAYHNWLSVRATKLNFQITSIRLVRLGVISIVALPVSDTLSYSSTHHPLTYVFSTEK